MPDLPIPGVDVDLIPVGRHNRPGSKITISHITIHNTDNDMPGADAAAHSSFVRKTGCYEINGKTEWVSWHYTVDDRRAIQQLPDDEMAYHAHRLGNSQSIAIEICMHHGIDQAAANDRAARLVALLLAKHGLDIGSVVTHQHWTGKNCPSRLLRDPGWPHFIEQVEGHSQLLANRRTEEHSLLGDDGNFSFNGMCWRGEGDELPENPAADDS